MANVPLPEALPEGNLNDPTTKFKKPAAPKASSMREKLGLPFIHSGKDRGMKIIYEGNSSLCSSELSDRRKTRAPRPSSIIEISESLAHVATCISSQAIVCYTWQIKQFKSKYDVRLRVSKGYLNSTFPHLATLKKCSPRPAYSKSPPQI